MTPPPLASTGYQLDADGFALCEHDTAVGRVDTLAVEASFGNAVPVVEAMPSLMRDGDLTRTTRDGNRVVTFRHRVTAQTPRMLDELGEALIAAVQSARQLRWQKPAGASSDCYDVLRVQTEKLADEQWDVRERRGVRVYRVSYECLPYVRSDKLETFTWTGGMSELNPLTSMTGWTTVSGSASYAIGAGLLTSSTWRARRSFVVDSYLWFKVTLQTPDSSGSHAITSVTINGVSIPDSQIRAEAATSAIKFYTVPVHAWRGQTVVLEFTLTPLSASSAALAEIYTRSYPAPVVSSDDVNPRGISVIDIIGTARTPCTISFTAPSGGAFVYTGPDPDDRIRVEGAGEQVFGKFTVTGDDGAEVSIASQLMWYPEGDHTANVGLTPSQLVELNPNGVWPTQRTGAPVTLGDDTAASQFAYPSDPDAAISYFATTGAKTLIAPSPALPQGYHGDAVAYERHHLHPGRSGFAVLNQYGDPINATVSYYPRWKHNAARGTPVA